MRIGEVNEKASTINKITYCGMLISLSAIGSLIKIQGSIAFDSMPGFLAALFLGPGMGAIVAGIGHLLTAFTSGFPLTLPMHSILVVEMAFFAYLFGVAYRRINWAFASILGILLNGPIAALIVIPVSIYLGLPLNGWALFYAVIIPLTVASALNILLAYLLFRLLNNRTI